MAVLSDPISDFLTRFKNAAYAGQEDFSAPFSGVKAEIARILQEEGYIWNYETVGEGVRRELKVKPKFASGRAVLTDLKRVSKPGRRQYVASADIPRVLNGLGISIISTSKGLMTGSKARKQKIGGEVIAIVW